MSGAGGGVMLLAFVLVIGGSILLYLLVQQEHDRPRMDRESATEAARKDSRDEDP